MIRVRTASDVQGRSSRRARVLHGLENRHALREEGTMMVRPVDAPGGVGPRMSARVLARIATCPFRLTHPGVRRTGCGRSSGAPALAPKGHPAWTHVFRVVFQTPGGRRPRRTADRPTGAFRVAGTPRRPDSLTPPGACNDDGGLRPWGSRRSCRRQVLHRSWLRGVLQPEVRMELLHPTRMKGQRLRGRPSR